MEEANLILEALGQLPFARVYEVIGKIQAQAREQLGDQAETVGPDGDPSSAGPSTPTLGG